MHHWTVSLLVREMAFCLLAPSPHQWIWLTIKQYNSKKCVGLEDFVCDVNRDGLYGKSIKRAWVTWAWQDHLSWFCNALFFYAWTCQRAANCISRRYGVKQNSQKRNYAFIMTWHEFLRGISIMSWRSLCIVYHAFEYGNCVVTGIPVTTQ